MVCARIDALGLTRLCTNTKAPVRCTGTACTVPAVNQATKRDDSTRSLFSYCGIAAKLVDGNHRYARSLLVSRFLFARARNSYRKQNQCVASEKCLAATIDRAIREVIRHHVVDKMSSHASKMAQNNSPHNSCSCRGRGVIQPCMLR